MKNTACKEDEPWLAHDPRVYLMYTARARELQSEAIGDALGTAGRFLAGGVAGGYRWIADGIRKRQTIAQLSRLDDRMLADIGIDRVQIPMIAQGLIAPSGEAPRRTKTIGNALGTAGRFLAGTAAGAYRRIADRIRKRQTIAQLSRLDDRVLADIGIDRAQIPMIAQGLIAPSGEAPRRTIAAATCPPEYLGDAANDTRPPSVAA